MADEKKEWFCPKCKTINDSDFTHCRICGAANPEAPVTKKCGKCGFGAHEETCCPVCGSDYFLQL